MGRVPKKVIDNANAIAGDYSLLLPMSSLAELKPASDNMASVVFVSDAGPAILYSDGINWRKISDDTILA